MQVTDFYCSQTVYYYPGTHFGKSTGCFSALWMNGGCLLWRLTSHMPFFIDCNDYSAEQLCGKTAAHVLMVKEPNSACVLQMQLSLHQEVSAF